MNCKKIIALAAALTQLCVLIPATHAASVETDTVVYDYDYTQYADGAAAKAKGITTTANSWGTLVNNSVVGDKTDVYWIGSPKSNYTELTDITKVDIISDNKEAAQISENDVVIFDIDYGIRMSQTGSNEIAKLRFIGTDADGQEQALAAFTMDIPKNLNTGTAYFDENTSVTVPYIGVLASAKAHAGQRSNLRIAFDMKNKTYSAWFIKRSEYGASSADEGEPALMVKDVPMACGADSTVKYPSAMYYSVQNNAGSDTLSVVSMKTTILSDASVVASSKDFITVAETVENDIELPTLCLGSDIKWTSDTPDVITNDGIVTRPAYGSEDAVVNLTAEISRGTVSDTKKFTVTVPAHTYVPGESNEGIWTIDNMEYASSADIPTSVEASDYYYVATAGTNIAEKEDVTEEALNSTDVNGYVYADNNKVSIIRAGSEYVGNAQDTTITKYLSQNPQHENNDIVLEFEYERIGSPDVYIAIQALNSWKGPATVNNIKSNTLRTYAGEKTIAGKDVNKVTIVFHGEQKTFDTYFNGALYQKGEKYRYTDAGTFDISRIGFTVKGDTAKGDGIALHYVRLIDESEYGKWALEQEKAPTLPDTVDAYTISINLPLMGEYNNDITWTSSNKEVITDDGTVNHGAEDVVVTMNGTYTNIVTGETKPLGSYEITVEKEGEMTAAVSPIENLVAGGTANISVNLSNASSEEKAVDIYYACYTSDGSLISVVMNSMSVKTGNDLVEKEISIPENAVSFKAFVWTPEMNSYAMGFANVASDQ